MRKGLALSLVMMAAMLGFAVVLVVASQPKPSAYRYCPYHPYSVETSIRDS